MGQRTFCVLVEWVDGDTMDADELFVVAKSAAEAKSIASSIWDATNGAKYPNCRREKVSIFTKRMMRSLA